MAKEMTQIISLSRIRIQLREAETIILNSLLNLTNVNFVLDSHITFRASGNGISWSN